MKIPYVELGDKIKGIDLATHFGLNFSCLYRGLTVYLPNNLFQTITFLFHKQYLSSINVDVELSLS